VQWWFFTTARNTPRIAGMNGVRAIQAGTGMMTRWLIYINLNQTTKNQVTVANDPLEYLRDTVQHATEGNQNWYLKQPPPNQAVILEPDFDSPNNRQCNPSRGGGLNSLGETMWQAFFRRWLAAMPVALKALLSGVFFDNANQRVPDIFFNNGASATTSYDMNGDGTADARGDAGASGTST
jgi:hypothetical protein